MLHDSPSPLDALERGIRTMPLVDHHVHSVFAHDVDRHAFESAITEGPSLPKSRATQFDSQIGFAVRRFCAPVLDLGSFAEPDEYIARRRSLGYQDVTSRLTRASGIESLMIDGGYATDQLMSDAELATLSGASTHSVVRLESVAESVITHATSGEDFLDRLAHALDATRGTAVGYKSVAAYRCGLNLDPAKPEASDVAKAAARWLNSSAPGTQPRLSDPVIIRHLIWWALGAEAVLQFHTGFGDPDLDLQASNPALLQPLLARTVATGGRVTLLHCYPYEREAGYLCHVFPHVFMDVGLTVNYLGSNADSVVRASLDLAPFHKVLFSSDAWGLPELVYLGAELWRRSLTRVLTEYVTRDEWPVDEALRIARSLGRDNAHAVYFPGGQR